MSYHRRLVGVPLLALLPLAACRPAGHADGDVVRGRGLRVAALPVDSRARIYEAALGAAFELGPSLTLLLDPRLLPRTAGLAAGETMPAELAAALRRRAIVRGVCQPPTGGARRTPRCDARAPGYVVRFSDVFRVAPDSVQVHLAAQRYDTRNSGPSEALRFEKVFQLVGREDAWRAVREARVP